MSRKQGFFITDASSNQPIDLGKPRGVNFQDYELRRLGIKAKEKTIVVEYRVPSSGKRFHHFIKLAKYQPLIEISQSLNEAQTS